MGPWMRPIVYAFVAGSATAIGGCFVLFFEEKPSDVVISFTLSFAAGVMIVVSVLDLWLPIAILGVVPFILSTFCLFLGMTGTSLLSKISIPEPEELLTLIMHGGVRPGAAHSPSSYPAADEDVRKPDVEEACVQIVDSSASQDNLSRARSWRLGILLAIVLTVHNLPEGLAVGVSALKSRELGLLLASAIFLHNVAEGVVIAVPILAATGNKWLALGITAASGMTEPIGAAIGVFLLRGISNGGKSSVDFEFYLDVILCFVGGVMLQVSRIELLPQALRMGDQKTVTFGFIFGGALIGASIFLLRGIGTQD